MTLRHAREEPVPVEAALLPDPDLALVWAPMSSYPDGGSCRFEACESDEACTCQEEIEE